MTFGERVFQYCERGTNEALLAEPVNALEQRCVSFGRARRFLHRAAASRGGAERRPVSAPGAGPVHRPRQPCLPPLRQQRGRACRRRADQRVHAGLSRPGAESLPGRASGLDHLAGDRLHGDRRHHHAGALRGGGVDQLPRSRCRRRQAVPQRQPVLFAGARGADRHRPRAVGARAQGGALAAIGRRHLRRFRHPALARFCALRQGWCSKDARSARMPPGMS